MSSGCHRGVWKRKAKSVAKFVEERGWDAVLLSEVWADDVVMVWMGQDAELTALVHSKTPRYYCKVSS